MKPPIHTKEGYKIADRAGWRFLGERIRVTQHRKETLEKEVKRIQKDLAKQLDWSDYDNIIEKNKQSAEVTFLSTKRRLIEKFNKLKEKTAKKQ